MRRLFIAAFIVILLFGMVPPARAQTPGPPVYITNMVKGMTPEELVGQLFLVTFKGREASAGSQAYDLIVNYHVGGLVLLAANDNFVAAPETIVDAYRLITELQAVERTTSGLPLVDVDGAQIGTSKYIPLWIGVTQEGNGAPNDQILQGLTPLPSEMALGATWQPSLAQEVGAVAGRELSALGFNMIFGPSLDVLDNPSATSSGDLATRVFGGDPFWVGEMGRSYVSGLHNGSNNRLLVIAKHFPGRGSSDRLPDAEVSTIRKTLDQLKQIELAPFFAVTGNAPDALATADGLLVSHLRIQGLQGNNIRATTRPLSFDAQALSDIMHLPQFETWRTNGGLLISGDLGSRAVYDFYAPGGGTFNARLIVRDAFLAGNDMLYLGNIVSSDALDSYSTITQVLKFFAQKYREDTAFAQRVDEAVTRILVRKYQMYGNFTDAQVTRDVEMLSALNTSNAVTSRVAGYAATLLSPDPQDLDTVLPTPPVAADYLVFLTDNSLTRQCSTCPEGQTLATDALQQSVLRLYGTPSGGQVLPSHLTSYTFKDLSNLLDGTGGEFVEPDLRRAQWVIISLTDTSAGQPQLISRFLAARQDLLRGKRVILFAFGAPYYFDSTDISKLTAYFALYSKTPPFVDTAARVLFQEVSLNGKSPVSITGIDYDLISVTAPDPGQIISLFLDLPAATAPTVVPSLTTEPTIAPPVRIGDTVTIRTGEILDNNGNLVPDGTIVRFSISLGGEGGLIKQEDAQTSRGVARITYRLEKPGLLEIRAASEPATVSQVLQLDVIEGGPFVVTVIVPVASPTETLLPTPVTPIPSEESDFVTSDGKPRFGGWLLILFVLGGGAWLASWVGSRIGSSRWGTRWGLSALLGGLLVYNYLAIGLPGATNVLVAGGGGALVGLTIVGEILGAFAAWFWMWRNAR